MNSPKSLFFWIIVLLVSGVWELAWGPVDEYVLRLLPISIWQLPERAWPAIGVTIIASVVAWIAAILIGGFFGFFTATGELAKEEEGWVWSVWAGLATAVQRIFQALYVIPLVLTISFLVTLLTKAQLDGLLVESQVGAVLILSVGVFLAGQRIFIAITDAVVTASSDDLVLAKSIYLGEEKVRVLPAKAVRIWRETKFLLACKISLLAQAVEQAFHLAVVSVVILETVSGLVIYRLFMEGAVKHPTWEGGIGRVILDGQAATSPELVAGAVWLILILDSLIAWLIRGVAFKMWVHPYRRNV